MILFRSVAVAAMALCFAVDRGSQIVTDPPTSPMGTQRRDEGIAQPPQSRIAEAKLRQQKMAAIQLEILRQRQANFDVTIREINRIQSQHHELMKEIIRNIGPSGRYEYNPATGRYDRYVPIR
jgi:hypothetical protein